MTRRRALPPPDEIAFLFAVREIERRLGLPPGAAESKLREWCASGDVRSWSRPYSWVNGRPQEEGDRERVEPSAWRSREIDLMIDSNGCEYFVEVSSVDLEHQLHRLAAQPANSRRDVAILVRLKAGDCPPKSISWKVFCERIRKDCGGERGRGFSDETITKTTRKLMKGHSVDRR
jgi:hypothetical protein